MTSKPNRSEFYPQPDKPEFCPTCGIPHNEAVTNSLWDIYHRIRDGRQTREPLVFTQDYLEESGYYSEDPDDPYSTHSSMMAAMERDMYERGLCVTCGRPNLTGVKPEDIMTHEEAQDIHDMWAEQAAERRMGA